LKVTTESVATREVELTIEPEAAFVEKAMREAGRHISRIRPLPGYRPGKAPYALVERTFGRETVLNEALQEHWQGLFSQAVTDAGVDPYEAGMYEVVSTEPVVLKTRIPLMPVTTLGDYQSLHIEPEPEPTLTEERLDEEIEMVRRRHAEYEPVERPVEIGDQIVATIKGTVDDEDLLVDRTSSVLNVNADMTPPGFAESIVGMKAGDSRQFTLSYPADFEDENLAGKTVQFDVAVETVRQVNLPELNDEFAKTAGDYDTLAEMRTTLGERLEYRMKGEAQKREMAVAVEALVSASSVEYPQAALETEINGIIEARRRQLQQLGFEFEKYLEMVGRTFEQVREEARPDAERNLVRQMVIYQFARVEGLSIDPAEVSQRVERIAASYGDRADQVRQQLMEGRYQMSMYMDLLQERAMEHLADLLTGRVQPNAKQPDAQQEAEAQATEQSDQQEPSE